MMEVEDERKTTRELREVEPTENGVLPQWAFEIIRPTFRFTSRVLWRARFRGTENIPPYNPQSPTDGLIIAANHQTYLDPFWVSIPVVRPVRYLAWDAAFDWFLVGKLIKLLGAHPLAIERGDRTAMRYSLTWLQRGGALMIFPEGGRGNRDGSLLRFKPGAVRLALEAGVPVLPVTIRGAHKVWSKGQTLPRFTNIEIVYHPIVKVEQQAGEDLRECERRETDRLRSIIESAL